MFRFALLTVLSLGACACSEEAAGELAAGLHAPPVRLFSEPDYPSWPSQDDGFIYYVTRGNALMRAAKSGGAPAQIATLPESPSAVALGGGFVYAIEWNGDLWRVAKAGGVPQRIATALGDPRGLTADATTAYVVIQVNDGNRWPHSIRRVGPGGSATEIARSTYVTDLTSDDSALYWTDEAEPNPAIGCGRNAGSVHRVPKLGGANVTLTAGGTCLGRIALDATHVYYSSWSLIDGEIRAYSVSKSSGLPRLQIAKDGHAFAVDGSHLYYVTRDRRLARTLKSFYWPQTLAGEAEGAPLVDASRVYFWRYPGTSWELWSLAKL
jgi:hypothetical protein